MILCSQARGWALSIKFLGASRPSQHQLAQRKRNCTVTHQNQHLRKHLELRQGRVLCVSVSSRDPEEERPEEDPHPYPMET